MDADVDADMDGSGDSPRAQPEFFVARDRARRFTRYIREALQERRLNYRGAEVGLVSLVDEADENLTAVVNDAQETVASILGRHIRDRERGYMEMPLVVLSEGLIDRVDLARRLDRALLAGGVDKPKVQAAVLALLDDAIGRLDAYCGAYDEKRPLGPRRPADLAHLLIAIEREAAWQRVAQGAGSDHASAPYDKPPPSIVSDPNGLEDLLRAARSAVGTIPGPWHVQPASPGQPLTLTLGAAQLDARPVPAPERLVRAAEVLSFLHPVSVACLGSTSSAPAGLLSPAQAAPAPEVQVVCLRLADEAAGSVELTTAAAAGPDARLTPDAERAVRSLLEAPPLPDVGPPPPARLIALLGLLRALDTVLVPAILGNVRANALRVAASRLPRDDNRKAAIRRATLNELEARFPGFPSHRVEEIAVAAGSGKLAARHLAPTDAAVLLALFGRSWLTGGSSIERSISLEPLSDEDVESLVVDLAEVGATRKELELGRVVDAVRITRLERSAIAALGRLGRIPPGT